MTADVCSDISSLVTSPRISFSYDLDQSDDVVPVECHHRRSDAMLLDFANDFDFGITSKHFVQEISSADELFSNGKIIPAQIKKCEATAKENRRSEQMVVHNSQPITEEDTKKKRLKEFLFESNEEEKAVIKSFWQFKRSASLNGDNGRSKGLIRSLNILARSKSTGSAPNTKQTSLPKVIPRQSSQKSTASNPPIQSFNGYPSYNSLGRPPSLKKSRSYGNGVIRVNPILNISPCYVSNASFFGFGSFFCNGKSKKKKK